MATDDAGDAGPGLEARLRATIAATGPITFAEFMEAALYDPAEGFYARSPVGEHGEFVTAPHVSPLFGVLVARQVEDFWELLGRPAPFTVVELGAGDGTLAGQVLEALKPPLSGAVRYVAVERGVTGRAALASAGRRAVASMDELEPVPEGCVIANELLDNLPFHRVRRTHEGLAEVFVTAADEGFALVEGPVSSPGLEALAPPLRPGQEAPVSPAALDLLDRAAGLLGRGYVWLLDYGIEPGDDPAPVHGYLGQRVETDVLTDPGSRDITAGVDFAALADHGRERGWRVWGPVAQREALLALGFRDLDRRAQERQVEAVAGHRGIEALRLYSNRSRANLLLGRGGLGAFRVLCLGVGVDPEPAPRSMLPPAPAEG